jgi:hypothetical protein
MSMADDVLAEGERMLANTRDNHDPMAGHNYALCCGWLYVHGADLIRVARAAQRWDQWIDAGVELRAALDALVEKR